MSWKDFLPITPTQWTGLIIAVLAAALAGAWFG